MYGLCTQTRHAPWSGYVDSSVRRGVLRAEVRFPQALVTGLDADAVPTSRVQRDVMFKTRHVDDHDVSAEALRLFPRVHCARRLLGSCA